MRVLITGNKGFIGKNLTKCLQEENNIEIIGYDRENTLEELNEKIINVDFIFHLAGEVRPKSEDKIFEESNLGLTQMIIEILEKNNLRTPILMASTIHAGDPKNAYGSTKKGAEELLKKYHENNYAQVYIYRLPHVFGEGCKPNYNSVVTTWIYNSIKKLDIVVFDREIKMNYVYVQDIVKEFKKCLNIDFVKIFNQIPENYATTLGEVVDYIEEFNGENKVDLQGEIFKEKLYNTYLYYLKNIKSDII